MPKRNPYICSYCKDVDPEEPDSGVHMLNSHIKITRGFKGFIRVTLEGHGDITDLLPFCSAQCVVDYVHRHRDGSTLFRVPANVAHTHACDLCGQSGPYYYATYASYGSILQCNCFDPPNYFCSTACLIRAYERDAQTAKVWRTGKWLTPPPDMKGKLWP
ncbi:hypothetical protein GF380_05260 [Candidatus Uhrbacteria bacterium]|nr:hypothetical protein [Candidatus Uhrbacteria bacterium]MBD3284440.1 hypothetical protein [Candidatus Uhrbacteria bacterium]